MTGRRPDTRGPGRVECRSECRADDGGVWIITGVLLGLAVYAGVVVMAIAGFTVVMPLVVIPPVLVALIGANNLIGGGRTYGRSTGRPVGQGQAPLSSSGPNGPVKPDGRPAMEGTAVEEPYEPR